MRSMPTHNQSPLVYFSGARVVASPPVVEIPVTSVATQSPEVQPVECVPIREAVAPGLCSCCCAWMLGCCQLVMAASPLLPACWCP